MKIRLATPKDATTLAEMRYMFRAGVGRPVEAWAAFVARCARWMTGVLRTVASDWRCWVAEHDGTLVGHVWLRRVEKIPNPIDETEAHGYVTNLFVTPGHRGHGTGERLLCTALRYCEAQRFDAVVLWPTPKSRSLYRRHGFRGDDLMQLRRRSAGGAARPPRGTARRTRTARRSTAGTGTPAGRTR